MDDDTDSDLLPSYSPAPSKNHAMMNKGQWLLSQRNPEEDQEPDTENSDMEFHDAITSPRSNSSINIQPFHSTINHLLNKAMRNSQKRSMNLFHMDGLQDGDTDDEFIPMKNVEYSKIVMEELGAKGKQTLELKLHNTISSTKPKPQSKKMVPRRFEVASDDTDVSDVDVGMLDYYAIRHENEKNDDGFENNSGGTDVEEEMEPLKLGKKHHPGDTSESEVEVNIKDYYVIRHDTAPKAIAGPFAIDFGQLTRHQSSMKDVSSEARNASRKLPIISHPDNSDDHETDNEEVECHPQRKFSSFGSYINAIKDEIPAQLLAASDDVTQDEDSYTSGDSSHSYSDNTEDIDLDKPRRDPRPSIEIKQPSEAGPSKKRLSNPVIRMVELDGLQGAVSLLCQPTSPTRDAVHGIKFKEEMEKTEEISYSSGMVLKNSDATCPPTDDEDVSDLESDYPVDSQRTSSHNFLNVPKPKTRKSKPSRPTPRKATSMQDIIALDKAVSFKQFVMETEHLSESDVMNWSDSERNIVRRLSGDFGKLKILHNCAKVASEAKASPSMLHSNNDGKLSEVGKGAKRNRRTRKRGKKKSGQEPEGGRKPKPNARI